MAELFLVALGSGLLFFLALGLWLARRAISMPQISNILLATHRTPPLGHLIISPTHTVLLGESEATTNPKKQE